MMRAAAGVALLVIFAATSLAAAASPPTSVITVDRPSSDCSDFITFMVAVKPQPPASGYVAGEVLLHLESTREDPKQLEGYLSYGIATFQTALAVGSYSVHAEYVGSAAFGPSASEPIPVTRLKAETTIVAQTKPYYIGGPSPLIMFVRPASGASAFPPGDLVLAEGGVVLSERSAGAHSLVFLDQLPAGDHSLTLTYRPVNTDCFQSSTVTAKVDVLLPSLSIVCPSVTEGDNAETIGFCHVTLSAPVTAPVRVSFVTVGGSATEGVDYQAAGGVLEFGPRDQSRFVPIRVNGDRVAEGDETLSVV